MPKVSICIPSRKDEDQYLTLRSLAIQSYQDFEIIICIDADCKGANYARNEAVKKASGKYILFSDNDINWHYAALETLVKNIDDHSVCYGWFMHGNKSCGRSDYNYKLLQQKNFITMNSLVLRSELLPLDEELKRHQDWDLWLRMAKKGAKFKFINQCLFDTPIRQGISYGGSITFNESVQIIKTKHNLI